MSWWEKLTKWRPVNSMMQACFILILDFRSKIFGFFINERLHKVTIVLTFDLITDVLINLHHRFQVYVWLNVMFLDSHVIFENKKIPTFLHIGQNSAAVQFEWSRIPQPCSMNDIFTFSVSKTLFWYAKLPVVLVKTEQCYDQIVCCYNQTAK